MTEVPRLRTPIDELSMTAVLRDAYNNVAGKSPTPQCLAVAWSQCALEHGHGRYLDCHCYGNVTAGSAWVGDHFVITFTRKENPYDAPKGDSATFRMKFRAFNDHIDGARSYWSFLRRDYATAFARFEAGDPSGAAAALKSKGYFTAPLGGYQAAMVSLYKYALKNIVPVI